MYFWSALRFFTLAYSFNYYKYSFTPDELPRQYYITIATQTYIFKWRKCFFKSSTFFSSAPLPFSFPSSLLLLFNLPNQSLLFCLHWSLYLFPIFNLSSLSWPRASTSFLPFLPTHPVTRQRGLRPKNSLWFAMERREWTDAAPAATNTHCARKKGSDAGFSLFLLGPYSLDTSEATYFSLKLLFYILTEFTWTLLHDYWHFS